LASVAEEDEMSILIIDDFDEERDVLQTILRGAGFGPLVPLGSAREALQILGIGKKGRAGTDVDLVLMDLAMPEMDGLEACRRIRGEDRLQNLPIIVITARTEAEDIQAAYTAGATDYIRKPVIPAEVVARAANALSLKQEADARRLHEQELLERTKELDHAFEQITRLRGTLQICAKCKRVQTEGSFWQRVEDFLRQHSGKKVSESVCETCMQQAYPHLRKAK
jgi:CheY-like chemotaxis protein